MKRWAETEEIARHVVSRARRGEPSVVATLVSAAGSSYRTPGARLLLDGGGRRICGGVSAGCIEQDVALRGIDALASRRPALVPYNVDTEDADDPMSWDMGCGGSIEVFIQPLAADEAERSFGPLASAMQRGQPTSASTVLSGERVGKVLVLPLGPSPAEAPPDGVSPGRRRVDGEDVFVEALRPPPALLVFGGGAGAVPLVRLASEVGFRTTVVDHRPSLADPGLYPGAAGVLVRWPDQGLPPDPWTRRELFVLLMTHTLRVDLGWLEWALARGPRYVGVLGSRRRIAEVRRHCGDHPAVFGPVGLDVGAEGPEQIAVSIVAEMLAVHAGCAPSHLREAVP